MMMANFMNLCNIHPDEVYRWFMEFSCDSYDWVMINNVYSMGMWADGGLTMKKPYISSDNYILKMSDYKKDEYWEDVWNDLFYYFLHRNEKELKGTPYLRNLVHFKNKSPGEQSELIARAQGFIDSITN
jgi:deoxyribodipyrimidine photolyase-related protein